jgi:exoribonuclease R
VLPSLGADAEAIKKDIGVLSNLAKRLKEHRSASGILDIHSERLDFDLDINGCPTDCGFHQREESSKLIEEVWNFQYLG